MGQILRIEWARCLRNRFAAYERVRRHGRDGARCVLVDVRVVDVIDDRRVVNISDVHVVDAVVVRRAVVIRRMPRLSRSECEPRYAGAHCSADRQVDTPMRAATTAAADEGHQRRCIHRRLAHDHRTRHPCPRAADIGPASIVERCEAPRCVIHPCPAPRRDPCPVAFVIRRPAGRNGYGRHPHFAVARVATPRTVGVEVFITGDFARHVARGDRVVFRAIAACDPLVERIECRCGAACLLLQVGADKLDLLARVHLERAAVTVHRGGACANRDSGRTAVGRYVDAEQARGGSDKRYVRRIDLEVLTGRQRAHVSGQRALRDLQLRDRVVQVDDVERGLLIESQCRRTGM